MLKPSPETQSSFNYPIKNTFPLSFDSLTTAGRDTDTHHLHIKAARKLNTPKQLLAAHQISDRSAAPNGANNTAVFDNLAVRNRCYSAELDGMRYPGDSINVDYGTKVYLDQNRDLKLFYK